MSRSQSQWRFQFSLKSLLIAMTIVAVVLAALAKPLMEDRRNERLLDYARNNGFNVTLRSSINRERSLGRLILAFFGGPSYVRYQLLGLNSPNSKLTDDDLEQVVQVQPIKELDLQNTQITDDGLSHLQKLVYLRKLNLSGTHVTDQGIRHLLEMPNLVSLNVTGTQVTYAALEKLDDALPFAHFCEEKAIDELLALGVQVENRIRPVEIPNSSYGEVVEAGRKAPAVIVGMNRNISLTAIEIAHLNYLPSLSDLDFHTVSLGPGGLTLLKRLPTLKRLSIFVTNLTDQDLESIGRQTQLEELEFGSCLGLTEKGLSHLSTLKQLKKLTVSDCRSLSPEALSQLAHKLPNCHCEF